MIPRIDSDWLRHPGTQQILRLLARGGWQAFVVGGCVRNSLLSVPVADIDIATDALPAQVQELANAEGLRVIPTGIEHGTVTVIAHRRPHEVTTFRRDVTTDGRRAVVQFSDDLVQDAQRRDFTMNALYADAAGTVIDPLDGLPDLLARHVRFIGDPMARIAEDHLRILRFFRFHAWYGDPQAGLDPDSLAACAATVDGIDRLSRERTGAEMLRLLAAPDPAPSVAAMQHAGILARVLAGADARQLAVLVHIERAVGAAPSALRRLAMLGGEPAGERLRLSRSQAATLDLLRSLIGDTTPLTEIAFRHGAEIAKDVALLRSAQFEVPPGDTVWSDIALGAGATFPVAAADLMPRFQGRALGARLAELQRRWIESRFTLTRDELLG